MKKPVPTLAYQEVVDYLRYLANRYDDLAEEWEAESYSMASDCWDYATTLNDAADVVARNLPLSRDDRR